MNGSSLVLLASARPAGHTAALVAQVLPPNTYSLLDLREVFLYPYSYTGSYPPDDDFASISQQLVQHPNLVFATPVYWYAMSGLLKTFFDRLTDLITINKPLGRQLRGKQVLLLATGTDEALPAGFEEPFRRTAQYFGMTFAATLYHSQKRPVAPVLPTAAQAFRAALAGSSA